MIRNNFVTFATTNTKKPKIKNWVSLTKSNKARGVNYGILCGELSDLLVIDVDTADNGLDKWDKLVSENDPFNTTIVATPSGGLHYYFKHRAGLRNSIKNGGMSVDVRTTGGFVMGFDSKGYQVINDTPRIEIPEWLFKFVKPKTKQEPELKTNIESPMLQYNYR